MGHYDNCREGYCGACGQASGVIWGCGHEGCANFHEHLRRTQPERYKVLTEKLRVQREAAEEERVTKRQIRRHTVAIAQKAKEEFDV